MASTVRFSSDEMSKGMLQALVEQIRDGLRERIMERIEPDIQAAIDTSLESMKVSITQMHELATGTDLVKVIIERKDKQPPTP